tara:strand:- start:17585 stop:18925 length:1341 start_codon:yes stop_codon:yes gene_type:complete
MIRSLQSKLSAGLLLSLITAFIVLWVFVSISIRYLTEDYIYSRIAHDTETLLASVVKDSPTFEIETSKLGAIYQQPFSGHYYEIIRGDDVIRSRSLWDQQLSNQHLLAKNNQTTPVRLYQEGPQKQTLLVLVSHFKKQDRPITIIVAEDYSAIENAISGFQLHFTLSIAFILIILVGLQIWVLRRSLKPINVLQSDLKLLEQGAIRSLKTAVPSELIALVNEINHLHLALESRLTRHRSALSDLAHTLKKPLTVIQQISKDPDLDDLPDIRYSLQKQIETTRQLTTRILNRARLAGEIQLERLFDFEADLSGLLDTLNMMYRDKKVVISSNVESDLQCRFDREDLLELLGNLLDNACKWAKHKVNISITQQSSQLIMRIEDDGPGAPTDSLQAIGTRGVRLDETTEGHGLGLAIVSDIVKHYKGEISSGRSNLLGGFQIEIKLPLI